MQPFNIVLKNYRCFEDTNPLKIEVRSNCIALVGPNNSGKSSFLKFFYEMRLLFASLKDMNSVNRMVKGELVGSSYPGVEDVEELYYDRNDRELTIEIEFVESQPLQISKVRLISERNEPGNWHVEVFINKNEQKLLERNGMPGENDPWFGFTTTSGQIIVDFSNWFELCDVIGNSVYVGPFRNAIGQNTATYYDIPIGTAFISMWNQRNTGTSKRENAAAQLIIKDMERIFQFQRLEVNESNDKTDLQVRIDGKSYRLRELGAGFAQFFVVLAYVANRRPAFLLLDEPELNLHPSLQMSFLNTLEGYTTVGTIFATHSVGLARASAEQIYSFQKKDHASSARIFEQTTNLSEFLGEMSFSSFKEMGCDCVLLVEGVTEVKAIQQFLRVLHKEHKMVLIPLGGGQFIGPNRQIELNELKRLSNKVAVLIDSEKTSADDLLSKDREKFLYDCKELGFEVYATTLRAFENYLSDSAIKHVKGEKYRALAPFEKLKDAQPHWGKDENWRIALAMTEKEILDTDIGKFINALVD